MSKKKKKHQRPKAPSKPLPAKRFPWRGALNALLALAVATLCSLLFGAPRQNLIERKTNPAMLAKCQTDLSRSGAEVVLLGNSILIEAVDEALLSRLTATPINKNLNLPIHGSASAFWYLLLKNVLAEAEKKPKLAVVFFRDQYLTDPAFRTIGPYGERLALFSQEKEPILDRLAYLNNISALDYFLLQHWTPYQKREEFKRAAEQSVKNAATNSDDPDEAIKRVFADEKMDQDLLTLRQLSSETASRPDAYNFPNQLERSFLPHMARIAKESGIQLVFVRMKRLRDTDAEKKVSPRLVQYIEDLRAYLDSNEIPLIDFTHDKRIEKKHYGAGDHLSRDKGRPLFTAILAEALKPILP